MATATFDDILTAQRETNELLKKQKNPLDGRTGAGKALLDAQRETSDIAMDGLATLIGGQTEQLNADLEIRSKDASLEFESKDPDDVSVDDFDDSKNGGEPVPVIIVNDSKNGEEAPKSAEEEAGKDADSKQNKRFEKLGVVFKNQFKGLKNILGKLTSGAKGGLFAALTAAGFLALAEFLDSQTWKDIRRIIVEELPPLLDTLYKKYIKPVIDFFLPKFQKFFGDFLGFLKEPSWESFGNLIMDNKIALLSLAALLAPGLFLQGLKFGFLALKGAVVTLGGALTPILVPVLATGGVILGLVSLFFALKAAVDVIVDDLAAGTLTMDTLKEAFFAFFEGLAKVPTMLYEMLVPEELREKLRLGLADAIDGTINGFKSLFDFVIKSITGDTFDKISDALVAVGASIKEKFIQFLGTDFIQNILGYVDENILQPFKWVFGRLKNNLDEKLSSLGEFFDKILAPFQRAIRAFKEADGGLTGFGKVTAAIDAFGDSNYFGEETAAPNNVTNAMSGNSDTRTEKGEVLQQALLDKSARDAGSTPSVSVVSQDNSVRQNSQTTRSENVILVDPETAQVQAASP